MEHVDTWLEEDDIQRLWDVCEGTLPEEMATMEELEEFERVVLAVIWHKEGYRGQMLQ